MSVCSPFPPVHLDTIHTHLCPYLSVYDLCRLMQVSRGFLECFMVDRAFQHIRDRICYYIPLFSSVFEKYPWIRDKKRAGLKKRKTNGEAWVMPRGGIRYVIKRHLYPLITEEGLMAASKYKDKDIACKLIRGALQWGISTNHKKCHGGGFTYKTNRGGRIYFTCDLFFDMGSITFQGFRGNHLFSDYRTSEYHGRGWNMGWNLPGGMHYPYHCFQRCKELFMGLPITSEVLGLSLRYMVGEPVDQSHVDMEEVESYSYSSDSIDWDDYLEDDDDM